MPKSISSSKRTVAETNTSVLLPMRTPSAGAGSVSDASSVDSSDSTKSKTMKYIRNSTGEFVCPECGVIKKNQSTMHYHMKSHAREHTHECKICKKGFLQKQALDVHMKSRHPDEGDADVIECPFEGCLFTATTKGNCRIHCLRTHFMEEISVIWNYNPETKILECNNCNNTFNSHGSFYYHCAKCIELREGDERAEILKQIA